MRDRRSCPPSAAHASMHVMPLQQETLNPRDSRHLPELDANSTLHQDWGARELRVRAWCAAQMWRPAALSCVTWARRPSGVCRLRPVFLSNCAEDQEHTSALSTC